MQCFIHTVAYSINFERTNNLCSPDPVALTILNYKLINHGFIHLRDSIF